MKKILVVLLCLSLVVTGLFAGGKKEDNEEGAVITVFTNRTDLIKTVLADAKLEFEAKYAEFGWTLEFEGFTDYPGDVSTRISGGEYGDVLLIPDTILPENFPALFLPTGTIDEIKEDWRGVDAGKHYEGICYGIPTMANTNGVLYNTVLFEKAGITKMPTTPEEFVEAMKILQEDNKDNPDFVPYYTNFAAGWTLNQYAEALNCVAGDPGYKSNGMPWDREAFTTGPVAQVNNIMYDLVMAGVTEKDPTTTEWERSKVMLAEGDIGAMFLGGWAISQFQAVAEGLGIDSSVVGYMPYPYTAPDGNQYAPIATDYWLSVAANTDCPKAATTFQHWLMEDFDYCTKLGGLIPASVHKPYPAIVKSFEDNGVIFFESPKDKVEGALAEAEKISGLSTYANDWKTIYIENAFAIRQGRNGMTKEEIGAQLQAKWNKGIDSVIKNLGEKPE